MYECKSFGMLLVEAEFQNKSRVFFFISILDRLVFQR